MRSLTRRDVVYLFLLKNHSLGSIPTWISIGNSEALGIGKAMKNSTTKLTIYQTDLGSKGWVNLSELAKVLASNPIYLLKKFSLLDKGTGEMDIILTSQKPLWVPARISQTDLVEDELIVPKMYADLLRDGGKYDTEFFIRASFAKSIAYAYSIGGREVYIGNYTYVLVDESNNEIEEYVGNIYASLKI